MLIQILSPKVAASIAAGEVVERPASVVKELLENAIDAGATAVHIEIERGGLDVIRVSDNGCGIAADEIEVAFQRHATSKLSSAADLNSLMTLGFRGEALPSIAAAADVQLASRTGGSGAGVAVRYRGGQFAERVPFAGAAGTSVTVRNLFAQHPARLKFLRSAASEASQVAAAVHPYALAYPELRVSLKIDGRTVLQTTGSADDRDAAARVLGTEVAAALLAIAPSQIEQEGCARVRGLISPPSLHRATRSGITVFVNRRWVQPRRLTFAIEQAYATLLPSGRHPVAVVSVVVPPTDLDVNVHPAKAEVRFRDERAVVGAVMRAVRDTLVGQSPVPDFDPSSRLFGSERDGAPLTQAAAIGFGAGPALYDAPQPTQSPLWQTLLRPDEHSGERQMTPVETDTPRLPLLRVVGQTGGTYVVAEGPTGMYLIDQHAAHERVLYERIQKQRLATGVEVQGMLSPAAVELTPLQAAALTGYGTLLTALGFDLEPFGERTVLVRALPALLATADHGRALLNLLDALSEDREPPSDDRLVKTLACHGSVRAGKMLALNEMRELILQLEECEAPRTCPHGRPTMVHLSAATLEREFRRR